LITVLKILLPYTFACEKCWTLSKMLVALVRRV
jgi:hypothetical protein